MPHQWPTRRAVTFTTKESQFPAGFVVTASSKIAPLQLGWHYWKDTELLFQDLEDMATPATARPASLKFIMSLPCTQSQCQSLLSASDG